MPRRGDVIVGEIGVMVTVLVLAALIAWVPDVRTFAAGMLGSVITGRILLTQVGRAAKEAATEAAKTVSRAPRTLAPEGRELEDETYRMPSPSRVPDDEPEFAITSDPPPEPRRTRKGRTP